MKKFWIILLITFILIIGLGSLGYYVIYPIWGRTVIYKEGDSRSKYSGTGQITKYFRGQLFVIPKSQGRPVYAEFSDLTKFPPEEFDVLTIPAQDQIIYSVVKFQKWEDIPNSKDKYLIVKNPKTKLTEKHRVGNSDIFKDNQTSYAVEYTNFNYQNSEQNKIINLQMTPILKKGDTIIMIPVFDPPELSKKDEAENLLVSRVIVRNIGGKI